MARGTQNASQGFGDPLLLAGNERMNVRCDSLESRGFARERYATNNAGESARALRYKRGGSAISHRKWPNGLQRLWGLQWRIV